MPADTHFVTERGILLIMQLAALFTRRAVAHLKLPAEGGHVARLGTVAREGSCSLAETIAANRQYTSLALDV